VHRGAECLPPLGGDVLFVRAGERLAAAEYIEHRADGTGEEGDQYEAPFQDRRLGSGADIDRDEAD